MQIVHCIPKVLALGTQSLPFGSIFIARNSKRRFKSITDVFGSHVGRERRHSLRIFTVGVCTAVAEIQDATDCIGIIPVQFQAWIKPLVPAVNKIA